MKGEIVQNIYKPENDAEWVVIETDKGLYSMRLGGFKKEMDIQILNNHTTLVFPYKGKEIEEVLTDEEWVYLVLAEGGIIASGWVDINSGGDLKLGVKFADITEYEPGFFQSPILSKLVVGVDNWARSV